MLTGCSFYLQEFVQATKENSGLDMDKLGEQAGNRSPSALGELQTPQGDDVSGATPILCSLLSCSCRLQGLCAS